MLLPQKLKERDLELVLASQSPRRRDLMRGCGLQFDVVCYHVDEVYPDTLPVVEVPEYLAKLKSKGYPTELSHGEILITADTVVICEGEILGKPANTDEARAMLRQISNREHTVVTGVTIRSRQKSVSFSSHSTVRFAELTDEQIDYYIEAFNPLDKAGSYGIQEWIGYIGIESIEGSFYNVMGLPVQRLYSELNKFIEQ